MSYCRHLNQSLQCADPALSPEHAGIKCSWRGDCDRERPQAVMLQIERESVSPAPVSASVKPVRAQLQAARQRLVAAIEARERQPRRRA